MSAADTFIAELEASIEACPPGSLTLQTRFRDEEWWDSIAALATLAVFDATFGKQLAADKLRACETIADICALA